MQSRLAVALADLIPSGQKCRPGPAVNCVPLACGLRRRMPRSARPCGRALDARPHRMAFRSRKERMTLTSLLVANRGEIAVRLLRAAAEFGLRTVAISSEDD